MGRTHELSSTSELASHHNNRNPSRSPRPENPSRPAIAREEGELSSSDGAPESCNHSASPSATTAAPSSSARSVHTASSHPEANQDVTTIRENHQVSSASKHNRVHLQQKSGNSDLINQLPPKNVRSRISSQHDNRNLVISFSNDESSSGSDDDKKSKGKSRVDMKQGNWEPSALTTGGPTKYCKVPRNINLNMSKQLSLIPKFVPSSIRNLGGKKMGGAVMVGGHGTNSRDNINNKRMEGQDVGYGLGPKQLELEDLRHQISLRESELKLKTARLNKPSAAGSFLYSEALNSTQDSIPRLVPDIADASQLRPGEPPSKRLKLAASCYSGKSIEQWRPAARSARSLSPPKSLTLGSSKKNKVDNFKKSTYADVIESSSTRCKRQDGESVMMASQNLHENNQHGTTNGGDCGSDPALVLNHNTMPDVMTPNAFTNNVGAPLTGSLWSSLDNANASMHGNGEIQKLIEIEEALDKELEDAQEHRRKCEIEERNALKAYRKAQRALLEANARCAFLYRQRELYSSHLQTCIMDDSSLIGCSSGPDYFGNQIKFSNGTAENTDLIPSPSQQMQAEDDQFNQPVPASNMQHINGPELDPYQPIKGQNLCPEACSEPDGSISEPLQCRDNKLFPEESSSDGQTTSADEDVDKLPDSTQPKHGTYRDSGKSLESYMDIPHKSGRKMPDDNPDEALLLEATLRSKLFASLGVRARNSKGSDSNTSLKVEEVRRIDGGSGASDRSNGSGQLSEMGNIRKSDFDGNIKQGVIVDDTPVLDMKNNSLDQSDSRDFKEKRSTLNEGQDITLVRSLSTFSLRSAFHHLKIVTGPRIDFQHQNVEADTNTNTNSDVSIDSGGIKWMTLISSSLDKITMDLCEGESSCYPSDVAIDPFWPICMFDLRGKCNNDECPWQHVKVHCVDKMSQDVYGNSDRADCQVALASNRQCCSDKADHLKSQTPKYLVGLDILKADVHLYNSVVAQRVGQSWQKCFTISLAVSGSFKNVLNAYDCILQNNDGRMEVFGRWNSEGPCFGNRSGRVSDLEQTSGCIGQLLESALLTFNQEVENFDARRKALSMLSHGLKASPTSVVLWIAYLVIYYSKTKPVEKDDMYDFAVKHYQGSYEIWLMYINSRPTLKDRFAAYEEALSALHSHYSVPIVEKSHSSSCILDVFLQMIDCYCMSGHSEKAIQMIYNFLPHAEKSNEWFNSLLCYILSSCLMVSDKCIFWICCVYLVIYRKLPDAIVHQFECDKGVLTIEWPPAHLTDMERGKVTALLEFAVDDFQSCIGNELNKHVKLAQDFAVNHIRCKMALDGLPKSPELLDRYAKMYPTCLDLALMSARVENQDCEGLSFHGFENVIRKWPNDVDGFHCIWYQYAEYALDSGKTDLAKELMERWFSSIWKLKYPDFDAYHIETTNLWDDSSRPAPVSSLGFPATAMSNMDLVYGLLNLSLHYLMQRQHKDSQKAIACALKVANRENYACCVREHATFMLIYDNLLKDSIHIGRVVNLINGYLNDSRASHVMEPLSRKFMEDVDKPKVQQLIKNILCPLLTNSFLVNSVLDSLFGPCLLPQKLGKVKDLVDFVEVILDICPCNYHLAISLCKRIMGENLDCQDATVSASASVSFWAGSVLVSSLSHAVPIAPEYIWVEAAGLLGGIAGFAAILEGFYKKALSVYPFSVNLWKSYYHSANSSGHGKPVLEAAKEKGINLVQI
ncbi:hypothetical protein SAY86_024544 [Trapa natans]|uniref:Putative zinc-finger domain-containing protein n=1 Tax=Trapa natans TaxID=22666 RepID=A0AAN7M5E0_TRANT|nr:hypothetical protein SAY86_024544 [Trapa natans]